MGTPKTRATMTGWTLSQADPYPPSSPLSKLDNLITLGAKRRRRGRKSANTITLYYIHFNIGTYKFLNDNKSHNNNEEIKRELNRRLYMSVGVMRD